MDGRDLIKGASIEKSLKLQKQLAALKLTGLGRDDLGYNSNSKNSKNGSFKYNGNTYYFDNETTKALFNDLLSYGFTEDEAKEIIWN